MINFDANGKRIVSVKTHKLHHIPPTTVVPDDFGSKFDTISDSTWFPFRGMIHVEKLSECETYLKELENILK